MDTNAISESINGINLTGKTVVIRKEYFRKMYQDGDRRFKVTGGFGASPASIGRAVFGSFFDGEQARIDRHDVEGIAVNSL